MFPRFTHTYARTCSTLNDYFENSNNIYLSLISLINVYNTFVFTRACTRACTYVCMYFVYCFFLLNRMAFQAYLAYIAQRTIVTYSFFSSLSFGPQQQRRTGRKVVLPSFPSTRPVMLNFGDLTRTGVFHHGHGRWYVCMYVCMFNVYVFPYRGTVGNFFKRTNFKFLTKSSIEIINSCEFANDALISFISIKITC